VDRREKIIAGLDLPGMNGLEIGPRDKPIVRKAEGQIKYVDYMSTEDLKKLHRDGGVTDCVYDEIVDVDIVWGENSIKSGVGSDEKFDYIIASHVVEHVPDLITWINELTDVLKPGGIISLAVPDKRYCFDHLRDESSMTDVITAYFYRARRPQPQQVIDFCLNFHAVDTRLAWSGEVARPDIEDLDQLDHALAMAQSSADGIYHDVHCWAFTPESFLTITRNLLNLKLIRVECYSTIPTAKDELEFFVKFRKAA